MTTKLTDEELQKVSEVQNGYAKVYSELGQFSVKEKEYTDVLAYIQGEKEGLMADYKTLVGKETTLAQELAAKYGVGKLDLSTGEITVD
jgi:hypothetical protein